MKNGRLQIAVIGLGGQGALNLRAVSRDASKEAIVALCDVDDIRAGKAYESFPKARKFYDYREMLSSMEKEIDAVVISTPDHTHFHPAWDSMQLGKHVYLEKPLAHTVWEVRQLTDLAKKKSLATQLGVQRHTEAGVRRAVEIVKSGVLGPISEVHCWISGDRGMPEIPKETPPVPPTLRYDLWLGPAGERAFHPSVTPYGWRFYWDFGTGETGNWGCHILDIPFWALDLSHPERVDCAAGDPHPVTTPKSMDVTYRFAATRERPAVTLHWSHGTPKILAERGISDARAKGKNTLFVGREGMLLCGFGDSLLLPEDKFAAAPPPTSTLYQSPGFHREWLDACRGGARASCSFDYSGPMTETVLLGNVAFRAREGFDWDARRLRASSARATALLKPSFGGAWKR